METPERGEIYTIIAYKIKARLSPRDPPTGDFLNTSFDSQINGVLLPTNKHASLGELLGSACPFLAASEPSSVSYLNFHSLRYRRDVH